MSNLENTNSGDFKNPLIISSRKRRIAAFILDHFIFTFSIVAFIFLALGTSYLDNLNSGKFFSTTLIGFLIGFGIYFSKDSYKGTSPGKWIMGIMVRDEKDRNITPSFGRLFVRNLFIVIWPIEFLVMALNDNKKRIGDNITNSVVLKNPNKPEKSPRIIALISVGVLFFIFLFVFIGNTMKNSEAYKLSIQEIEKNAEIKKDTGGIVGYGFMPTGNVRVSDGKGQAQFEITVKGKINDVEVSTYLEKAKDGEWKLIELNK